MEDGQCITLIGKEKKNKHYRVDGNRNRIMLNVTLLYKVKDVCCCNCATDDRTLNPIAQHKIPLISGMADEFPAYCTPEWIHT